MFETFEIVLNTGTEETAFTVSVITMTTVGDGATGAETAGEERTPPLDEATAGEDAVNPETAVETTSPTDETVTGDSTGEEARIEEGMVGYAGCVPFAVYGQTVV